MTSENLVVTCIWVSDDFTVVDKKDIPTAGEAVLKIDETTETISVLIPEEFSLVAKKIIERRVQSIAKSGYLVPNSGIRIGGGFTIEMTKSDEIPTVLLQEGHKYFYGEFAPPEEKEPIIEKPLPSQTKGEYTPSFLIYDQDEQTTKSIPEVPVEQEEQVEEAIEVANVVATSEEVTEEFIPVEHESARNLIVGNFIIALSESSDIYLSKTGDIFSVEYSMGRVDFNIQNNEINILSTDRVPENDQTLQIALDKARKNSV
jgi:hypothetical protein